MWPHAVYIDNQKCGTSLKLWNTATSLIKEAARNIYNQKPGILLVKEIISNILALVLFQPAIDGQ